MKYMKLGSRRNTFYSEGTVRSVTLDVPTDLAIEVKDAMFLLHKFPLFSKCGLLQKLAAEACESKEGKVELHDIPGGAEAFELCAKFCYGITITLSAINVVAARCAAEYLEMTEEIENGNLTFKLEVFLNSSILCGWKDSVITLQATKALLPWSEDLKIISRCIDAIAWKTSVDPSKVDWSYTYSTAKARKTWENPSSPPWNGIQSWHHHSVPKDWWVEDISELEIDLYWRVIIAIKSTCKVSHELIGEALRVYALRWLPGMSKEQISIDSVKLNTCSHSADYVEIAAKHRFLLETIVSLLPAEKNSTSCSFLLKLLKAATILGASHSSKIELARQVGLQLEEANLNDLLIPSLSYANETLYDVDIVQTILDHFMTQNLSRPMSPVHSRHTYEKRRTKSAESHDFRERKLTSATYSSKLKVAKLVDTYLAEIARDSNLPISKFVALAEAIPDFARPVHDDLYRAIDIYLKEHPGFTKSERKRICRLLDCKKLSMEACMHAAQNEQLPLRVVVQVLFFEQVRAAMTGDFTVNELPSNIKALLASQHGNFPEVTESHAIEDEQDGVNQDYNSLRGALANMNLRLVEAEKEHSGMQQKVARSSKVKGLCSFSCRSKRIFDKLWSSKGDSNKNN